MALHQKTVFALVLIFFQATPLCAQLPVTPLRWHQNSCFFNALIHALFFLPEFHKAVGEKNGSTEARKDLQNLVATIKQPGTPFYPQAFFENVVHGQMEMNIGGKAEDSLEALDKLFKVIGYQTKPRFFDTKLGNDWQNTTEIDHLIGDFVYLVNDNEDPGTMVNDVHFQHVFVLLHPLNGNASLPVLHAYSQEYPKTQDGRSYTYELISMVARWSNGGHAVTYARLPGTTQWYFYNDMNQQELGKKVDSEELQQLLTGSHPKFAPRLLFYRRKGLVVEPAPQDNLIPKALCLLRLRLVALAHVMRK